MRASSHLRGMFAFAIWDEREQTCLLARDRFGIKPLYYHAHATGLVFASEVQGVARLRARYRRDLDGEAMYRVLSRRLGSRSADLAARRAQPRSRAT